MTLHLRHSPSRPSYRATLERLEDRVVPVATVLDPNLTVQTVADGFTTPIGLAFLDDNDFLVLEKNTGMVKRVVDGTVEEDPVLDLDVNFASERGLLARVDDGERQVGLCTLVGTQKFLDPPMHVLAARVPRERIGGDADRSLQALQHVERGR